MKNPFHKFIWAIFRKVSLDGTNDIMNVVRELGVNELGSTFMIKAMNRLAN